MSNKSDWSWKESETPNSKFIRFKNAKNTVKNKRKNKKRKNNGAKKKSFYSTWEWKKIRFKVLEKYGAVCMCCNNTENIVVDHIKPITRFPHLKLKFDNLQVLCRDCNMGKSNDCFTDFRPESEVMKKQREIIQEIIDEELDKEHLNKVVSLF